MNHYHIGIFLFLLALSGCDAPRESRLGNSETSESDPLFNQNEPIFNEEEPPSDWNTDTNLTKAPGYENCLITPRYGNSNQAYGGTKTIGTVGACRNEQSTNEFLVSFSRADGGETTCVQPIHTENDRSFYVGREKCINHSSNSVHSFVLGANRPGYENRQINALIVYKLGSKTAFYACMDSFAMAVIQSPFCQQNKDNWGYPNAACLTYAQQAQAQVCSSFKRNHPYVKVPL